ncbi:MAG: GAF domain-containing protein [Phycisphaerae bacterium]
MNRRDYAAIVAGISNLASDRTQRMQATVDAFWAELGAKGVSWIGFYLCDGADEMTLGPRRDKPACSPIGMHGACGRSFRLRRGILVRDVRTLGANYVACDPRDQAELVIPLFDEGGECWGVLDADSFDVGAFDVDDLRGMEKVLLAAGLTSRELRENEIDNL